jgi:Mg2+ and Co2+ transporter CorA
MLNHEDASNNIKLANVTVELTKTSLELAEATKRDAAAMKTIAIMTMTFLPATFFATVFSMPVLKWVQPTVIQGGFWVYLAVTLPSTVLCFILWIVATKWEYFVNRFKPHSTIKY